MFEYAIDIIKRNMSHLEVDKRVTEELQQAILILQKAGEQS